MIYAVDEDVERSWSMIMIEVEHSGDKSEWNDRQLFIGYRDIMDLLSRLQWISSDRVSELLALERVSLLHRGGESR